MPTNPDSKEPVVMSASEVREHFSEVVNRVARGEGRVIVEKHGTPAVAVVSIEDARRLRHDDTVAARTEFVDRVRSRFADVPDVELEREIDKAFAEMAEDRRSKREPMKTVS